MLAKMSIAKAYTLARLIGYSTPVIRKTQKSCKRLLRGRNPQLERCAMLGGAWMFARYRPKDVDTLRPKLT